MPYEASVILLVFLAIIIKTRRYPCPIEWDKSLNIVYVQFNFFSSRRIFCPNSTYGALLQSRPKTQATATGWTASPDWLYLTDNFRDLVYFRLIRGHAILVSGCWRRISPLQIPEICAGFRPIFWMRWPFFLGSECGCGAWAAINILLYWIGARDFGQPQLYRWRPLPHSQGARIISLAQFYCWSIVVDCGSWVLFTRIFYLPWFSSRCQIWLLEVIL